MKRENGNVRLAVLFASGLLAATGLADVPTKTYVWTGAQDAYWTNAANWTVDAAVASRCPGVAMTPGVEKAALDARASAEFSSELSVARFEGGSANTTIDLDGLYMAGQVLVSGASTPTYVFGTGPEQVLHLMAFKSGDTTTLLLGEFRIAADVVNMPSVKARFGAYLTKEFAGNDRADGSSLRAGFRIVNENERPFVLEAIGGCTVGDMRDFFRYLYVFLGGTGPVTLAATPTDDATVVSWSIGSVSPQTVTVQGTAGNYRSFYARPGMNLTSTLNIPADATLRFAEPLSGKITGLETYYCTLRLTGTGSLEGANELSIYTKSHYYPRFSSDIPSRLSFGTSPVYIHLTDGIFATITELSEPTEPHGSDVPLNILRRYHDAALTFAPLAGKECPWWLSIDDATGSVRSGFLRADGLLMSALPPQTDTDIAAKGSTVPNDATAVVGITEEGTGPNTGLAADETAVKSLVQKAACDATVAIADGQTLTAESIVRAEGCGTLTVGETAGVGSVVAGSFDNQDPHAGLVVKADCASPTLTLANTHTVTLAGGIRAPADLGTWQSKLELTGPKTYNFVQGRIGQVSGASDYAAELIVRDGAELVFGDSKHGFGIARRSSGYTDYTTWSQMSYAKMTVSNATVRSSVPVRTHGDVVAGTLIGALAVGCDAHGSLEILDGAVISNRLIVGGVPGQSSPAHADTCYQRRRGFGGVYQRAGTVTLVGTESSDYADRDGSSIGTGGQSSTSIGYYELGGGTVTNIRHFVIGSYGSGLLHLNGGTFTALSEGYMGVGNGSRAEIYQRGGTAVFCNTLTLSRSWSSGWASLTLDGPDADFHVTGWALLGPAASAGISDHLASINLNAGTLTCNGIACGLNVLAPEAWRAVSFNGGTLRAGRASQNLFGYPTVSYGPVEEIRVFAGGATIDTDGKTDCRSTVSFQGVTGGGVTGVKGFVPYKEVTPSPVIIEGDGRGAQAVMTYDSVTGYATGIRITCPGVGYTTATAKYDCCCNDPNKRWVELACRVEPNANTGSLTKKGAGDFTLQAANTYGGDTVLAGGTLRLGTSGALPEGSRLVPQGGNLAVADGVSLPSAITVDVSALDPAKKYDLIVFEGEMPAVLPTLTLVGCGDNDWCVRRVGNKIRLIVPKGVLLIVR